MCRTVTADSWSSDSGDNQFIFPGTSCQSLDPFGRRWTAGIQHAEVKPLQQRRNEQEHLHLGERVSETHATSWGKFNIKRHMTKPTANDVMTL